MIQDKALEIITRGPITYDGLRAELGCTPGELDGAIRSLETALAITRDRGRLRVAGPNGLAHQVADAQALTGAALAYSLPPPAPETKRCSKCGEDKSIEHFNKHPATKDGFDTRCRECVSNAAKARRIAAGKGVAPSKAPPPKPVATPQSSVAVLPLADGIRVGPLVASSAGVMQMPYYVDLTGAQLDDILDWWLASKEPPK